jgi:hypothetical protein
MNMQCSMSRDGPQMTESREGVHVWICACVDDVHDGFVHITSV